MSENLGMPW